MSAWSSGMVNGLMTQRSWVQILHPFFYFFIFLFFTLFLFLFYIEVSVEIAEAGLLWPKVSSAKNQNGGVSCFQTFKPGRIPFKFNGQERKHHIDRQHRLSDRREGTTLKRLGTQFSKWMISWKRRHHSKSNSRW